MKVLANVIVYLVIGFGTFSYVHNHVEWGKDASDQLDRQFGSVLGGVFWPVYWSGSLAFGIDSVVTSWLDSPKVLICKDDQGNTWKPEGNICRVPPKPLTSAPLTGSGGAVMTAPGRICKLDDSNWAIC